MRLDEMFKKGYELVNSTLNNRKMKLETSLVIPTKDENLDSKDTYQGYESHIITEKDDMSKDLMVMVGNAIEQWSKKYHMENVPKKIIFKQALTIMNGLEQLWFSE